MDELTIPRAAVEAAARALIEAGAVPGKEWGDLQPSDKFRWAQRAKHMLAAAAPLIVAAELDRIAEGLTVHTTLKMPGVADRAGRFAQTAIDDVRAELRERAADLRAQS